MRYVIRFSRCALDTVLHSIDYRLQVIPIEAAALIDGIRWFRPGIVYFLPNARSRAISVTST